MIPLSPRTRVYLALESSDMRKKINGLSITVEGRLSLDPFSRHLLVFCNRRKRVIPTSIFLHEAVRT